MWSTRSCVRRLYRAAAGVEFGAVPATLHWLPSLEHLDLKTEELRALLLPYEPVSASVRRLRLEIDPLSSSLRVDVENVDVALPARSAPRAPARPTSSQRIIRRRPGTFRPEESLWEPRSTSRCSSRR